MTRVQGAVLLCVVGAIAALAFGLSRMPQPPPDSTSTNPDSSPRPPGQSLQEMPAERLRSEAPDLTSRPAAATPSTPDTPATEPQVDLVGIESETDPLRVRWRVLRYGLQEYRRLKVKNALGPREGSLLCDSVSGILEASGRGEQADWNRSSTASQYYMVNNGRGYAWDVGEFPEYDAWREYWRTMAKYNEAPTNPKIPREPAPAFDSANFELFESRALEAIALLETRISGSSRPK